MSLACSAACGLQVRDLALGAWHTVSVRAVATPACPAAGLHSNVTWFEPAGAAGAVRFTSAPTGTAFSSFASFGFETTAALGTVSVEYSLDNSSWAPAGAALRVGPLAPGTHVMRVRATDGSAYSDVEVASWTVLSQSNYQLQVFASFGVFFALCSFSFRMGFLEGVVWGRGGCVCVCVWGGGVEVCMCGPVACLSAVGWELRFVRSPNSGQRVREGGRGWAGSRENVRSHPPPLRCRAGRLTRGGGWGGPVV